MKRRGVLLALVVTLALPAVVAAGALVAAHRGGAALRAENSLLAFRTAIGLGADFLETDVHLTADGEVVVIHDPTLDRTTTGTGRVGEARLADLRALRLRAGDGRVTDQPLPTLAALLEALAPSRAQLLLEIKVDAEGKRYAGIEERVLALVATRALRDRVVVMAFEPDTLLRVRVLDESVRTCLLIGRGGAAEPANAMVARALAAKATQLGVDHRLVDADLVAASRAADLVLAAWTVNAEPDIRRMIDLGVSIVITDRPDVALRLAR
jgi:glycerophosphoryl diester phosphodiesterase